MSSQDKYREAGVNQEAADSLISNIQQKIYETHRPEVMKLPGGYAGLFKLSNFKKPVLVSCTDGVGTKLKLAFDSGMHSTVGIDLVAMCVNDALCLGAEPLFFLDYIAVSQLETQTANAVLEGIIEGCKQSDCSLVGGETAQLPGFYQKGEYDLAGFCVGVVEEDEIITGSAISENDAVIGLESSGLHSNGFSLVRKILFQDTKHELNEKFSDSNRTLVETLLTPTKIYVKSILQALRKFDRSFFKGFAHITGGGITENVPRIVPTDLAAKIDLSCFERPEIFKMLQKIGNISEPEMRSVFNCGIGMVIVVDKDKAAEIVEFFNNNDEKSHILGEIVRK